MNISDRYRQQLAAVVSYGSMDELSPDVLDHLAKLRKDLPVIIVLYYGGTIGMVKLQDAFLKKATYVATDNAERLLEPLTVKGLSERVQVVWVQVCRKAIDSTNGRWVHWVSIGNAIRLLYDIADGFVVCGGTDTMAHLLAAVECMFPNIGKPVVGTGGQIPTVELGDDSTNNLYFAITAAASDLSGSLLMFGDELIYGPRVHKFKDKRRRAFTSADQFLLGHFDDELRIYPRAPRRNPIVTSARLQYVPHFREGIKIAHISPATPSESILYDAGDPLCRAMAVITFGAGNVRDEGIIEAEETHIQCLRQLYDRRYPVVLASPMIDGTVDSPYLGGAKAVSTEPGGGGAISGGAATGPLLEVKCMVALAESWDDETGKPDYEKFRSLIENPHVGELS